MMRSMYSAVSGLNIHQTKMDVVGNNIANVNTVGFKGSNVTFQEVFSQTVKGAGSPTEGKGGTNPQQIGLGASMGSITVNQGKGSTERTDRSTDLMIDGNGFFMVSDDPNAQNRYYTRAGNFDVDEEGNLVNAQGMKVLDEDMKPIVINKSATKKATQSEGIYLDGNINVNHGEDTSDDPITTTADVYDSLGDIHTLNVEFDDPALGVEMNPGDYDSGNPEFDPKFTNEETIPEGKYNADDPQDYSLKKMTITPQEGDFSTPEDIPDLYALFNEEGQVVDLVQGDGIDPEDSDTWTDFSSYDGTFEMNLDKADDLDFKVDRSIFFKQGNDNNERALTQYSKETDAKAAEVK
ncbi:MAG: flagellar hook-basal body complex protein, partial [Bacillota bacterium]